MATLTVVDNTVLTASEVMSLPQGTVGSWSSTSAPATTASTSETALYSSIASCTIVAGRHYKITAVIQLTGSAASTSAATVFVRSNVALTGTLLGQTSMPQSAATATFVVIGEFYGGTDIIAGTDVFTISAKAATGTLTGITPANIAQRPRLLIEDLGTT